MFVLVLSLSCKAGGASVPYCSTLTLKNVKDKYIYFFM